MRAAGKTVLVIAHRLSTIRDADQIAVLHQGQLKEVKCHQSYRQLAGWLTSASLEHIRCC